MGRVLFSAIVPCYNEESNIDYFYREFCRNDSFFQQQGIDFELIYIDDGSTDATSENVRCLREKDPRVQLISFSRNFGKEAAMYAGLEAADGDYTAIMDVDLQDPPELLIKMYDEIKAGEYDCVAARRATREGEPPVRSFFARCFYKLINKISSTEFVDGARDFRLMTKAMVKSALSLKEYNRFSKGIFSWIGYKTKWISYENVERSAGNTKWSFFKLLLYSIDGITAFSTAPLSIASVLGIVCCLLAIIMIIVVIVKTLIWGDPVAGYPSLVCIIFMLSGVQLFSIGIIGQYIAKTYMESKNRPIYIAKESNIEK